MKKIIISLLLLSSFLNASFLFDKNTPVCIEDYYVKDGYLYYLKSSNNNWSSTSSNKLVQYIFAGYEWDADNEICKPKSWLILGMDVKDWHFLEALTGLLFGFAFMVFTIYLFMNVGKEK